MVQLLRIAAQLTVNLGLDPVTIANALKQLGLFVASSMSLDSTTTCIAGRQTILKRSGLLQGIVVDSCSLYFSWPNSFENHRAMGRTSRMTPPSENALAASSVTVSCPDFRNIWSQNAYFFGFGITGKPRQSESGQQLKSHAHCSSQNLRKLGHPFKQTEHFGSEVYIGSRMFFMEEL